MRSLRHASRLLILAVLVVAAAFALSACAGHHHRSLNGHQTVAQKVAKGRQSRAALKAVETTRSPVARAHACGSLPEGYGHMGVCAAAPAYLKHARLPSAVVSGTLGIDTSHWDSCASYAVSGPAFQIVSVGDGSYVDPCAGTVYAAQRRAGRVRSTYYFTRQYLSPIWSADHYAALIRQLGATDSLLPTNDAEAISSCSWIHAFDNRLKADLHLPRVIDYSSPGLWPGCSGDGNAAWTAAYGPIGQRLSGGGWVSYVMQQTSDGNVGPFPHCLGVCGDIDLATASFNAVAVNQAPPSPPIAFDFWQRCSNLDAITFWKLHGGHGHVASAQHQQAVRIRKWLARNKIGCSAQPHSYPYRLPHRAGALA